MSSSFEWIIRNHYQEEDPGTIWSKDEGVVIDVDEGRNPHRVLTPNVIALPEGGFRMYYYSGQPERIEEGVVGCIVSSFSMDGVVWIEEPGLRVDAHSPDADNRTLCPDVVVLPGGEYRMYFQAHSAKGHGVILSAISQDAVEWTREKGVRFSVPDAVCGSPRCIPLEEGGWRLYCHEYPDEPKGTGIHTGNHVISAISPDGLLFEREPGVRIEQENDLENYAVYAVEVLRLGTGGYRMYYAGWSNNPVRGRIFGALSEDGLEWVKDEGLCLDCGGLYQSEKVSEPCVVRLPDGRFRMFYEANDGEQEWRILSATAVR